MSMGAAAWQFEVSRASVLRRVRRLRKRGDVRANPPRGRPSRIERERERVFRLVKTPPKLTVPVLQAACGGARCPY